MLKKATCLLVVFMMILSIGIPPNAFGSTKDYKGHWAEETIQEWLDKGLIAGYSDGSFKPEGLVTRAEFVKMANNMFGYSDMADISFTDVESDKWYYKEVQKAVKAGYIAGISETQFAPNDNVSREQAAVILSRIMKLKVDSTETQMFSDSGKISNWAKAGVEAAAKSEFIKGYEDNTFRPNNFIKRAEAIVILNRTINETQSSDLTIDEAGTVIENTTVENICITKKVGAGEVTLKNVTVTGELLVEGGGQNSVVVEDSIINNLTINKADGKVRILIIGETAVDVTSIKSGAILEQQDLTGTGFDEVSINEGVNSTQILTVKANLGQLFVHSKIEINVNAGTIKSLIINKIAEGATVNLEKKAIVLQVEVDSKVSFTGIGKIVKAIINADGVTFVQKPSQMDVKPGIKTPTIIVSVKSGSNGTTTTVSAVSLSTTATAIKVGGEFTLVATVLPNNATNTNLIWKSDNESVATVGNTGLVVGVSTGTAIITVTTEDGAKTEKCEVTVALGNDFEIGTSDEFKLGTMNNVIVTESIGDGVLTLKKTDDQYATNGEYISQIIDVPAFEYMIASWNSDTPEGTYVEIQAKVLVNHFDENGTPIQTWTDWLSWGQWSPFMERSSADTKEKLAKTSTDELIIRGSDGETACKVRMKAILHTDDSSVTPALRYLHGTLKNTINSESILKVFKEEIDITNLDKLITTPAYSQSIRCPRIAGSICSPTTITMMLNRFGETLLPEEVAQNTYDFVYEGFGNWAFAMASTASYGYKSYVDYTTIEGLKREIAQGYPVGVSVKYSNIPNSKYPYVEGTTGSTGGHLILVTGFTTIDGVEYVYVNDPYAKDNETVKRKYKLEQFQNAWSNEVAYIVHDKEINAGYAHTMRIDADLKETEVPNEYKVFVNNVNIDVQNFGGTIAYTLDNDLTYKYFAKITDKNALTFTNDEISNSNLKVYVITDTGKVYVSKIVTSGK